MAPELARERPDMTPAARASRATAATMRVSRRYDLAESGRLGPGT
ncbi:MAG TPA: hypothetical protein VF983_16065 [Streptosporangiaceae bacterium]